MTLFYYKATDRRGKSIEGDIEASDYRNAVDRVRGLNYFPIKISESKPDKKISFNLPLGGASFGGKLSGRDLVAMTQQLATLVDSGFTLDRALFILIDLTEKPRAREILTEVHKSVHGGNSFADSLAEYPEVFSKLYVNMIRAGETSGALGLSLNRVAEFLDKSEELKANIRSAMIYPCILTLVGGSAVLVLFAVVIPRFSKLFDELGSALPLPTKIMLSISSLVTNHWVALLMGLILAVAGFIYYHNHERGRMHWDGLVLRLPLFGSLAQ
ncbi:MAG: type II secretion system F family protein, partial [Nitrospinae bacterium]|nr:type II secretion system F family protein [Nitrospinota bacterium]